MYEPNPNDKSAVVVLSHQVDLDGLLSLDSVARTNKGIQLHRRLNTNYLIMNGGAGILIGEGREYMPLGRKVHCKYMRDYAIQEGVPKKEILIQPYSRDTVGEILYSARLLLEPNNIKEINVVTSWWHFTKVVEMYLKLLGTDYRMSFFGVDSDIDGEKWIRDIEKNTKKIFWKQFGDVSPNNIDEALRV